MQRIYLFSVILCEIDSPTKEKTIMIVPVLMEVDIDAWFDYFELLDTAEKMHHFWDQTLEQDIDYSFFKAGGYIEALIDFNEQCEKERKFDLLLGFYEKMRTLQNEMFKDTFSYVGNMLFNYCVIAGKPASAMPFFEAFCSNPNETIDLFLEFQKSLILYQDVELSWKLASETYEPVRECDADYINSPFEEIFRIMYLLTLERVYKEFKSNGTLDLSVIYALAKEYDIVLGKEGLETLKVGLTTPFTPEMSVALSKKGDPSVLIPRFFIWMLEKKGVPFYTSQEILDNVFGYFLHRKESGKTRQAFFTMDAKSLETYLNSKYSSFFLNASSVVVLLWGLYLLYDFLYEHQVISAELRDLSVKEIQRHFIRLRTELQYRLWESNIILQKLPKPDSMSQEDFDDFASAVASSFVTQIPKESVSTKKLSSEEMLNILLNDPENQRTFEMGDDDFDFRSLPRPSLPVNFNPPAPKPYVPKPPKKKNLQKKKKKK